MQNCTIEVDNDGIVVVTIDSKKKGFLSASQKSITIGTTQGNQTLIVGDKAFKLGVNFYIENPDYKPPR